MIIVWGSIDTTAGNKANLLDISLQHSRRSRTEPGCISHRVQIDAEQPNRILFFEEWEDMAALKRHFEVPESKDFVQQASKLATQPPTMKIYSAQELEN